MTDFCFLKKSFWIQRKKMFAPKCPCLLLMSGWKLDYYWIDKNPLQMKFGHSTHMTRDGWWRCVWAPETSLVCWQMIVLIKRCYNNGIIINLRKIWFVKVKSSNFCDCKISSFAYFRFDENFIHQLRILQTKIWL